MSRAVTADHVLFDECIEVFRRPDPMQKPFFDGPSHSFILLSHNLEKPWALPHCTLHPSKRVDLPGAASAFICRVDNPSSVGTHNPHLYGIALASIISFATGRLCKSTRDDYLCSSEELHEHELLELALQNPVRVAGPGGTSTRLSTKMLFEYQKSVSDLIVRLHSIPYKNFIHVMQSIRLVHLSLLNKREDFGLAYYLLVSAIESISQHAINKKFFREKHPSEQLWIQKANDDPAFSELLSAYSELKGKEHYLQKRYIEFIQKFAPAESWGEIVRHPNQDHLETLKEQNPDGKFDFLVLPNSHEKHPTTLSPEQIRKVLADSYAHRSLFVHQGAQPPHQEPNPYTQFFQTKRYFDGENLIEQILPNYELLFGIAQRSITNWAKTK